METIDTTTLLDTVVRRVQSALALAQVPRNAVNDIVAAIQDLETISGKVTDIFYNPKEKIWIKKIKTREGKKIEFWFPPNDATTDDEFKRAQNHDLTVSVTYHEEDKKNIVDHLGVHRLEK